MRTRFFTASHVSNAATSVQTLDFLRLPLPHISPLSPQHHSTTFDDFHCSDDISVLTIENFPIENALSKFFNDSLPHIIDVNFKEFARDQQSADKPSSGELLSFDSKQQLDGTDASEVKNGADIDEKGEKRIEFIQFEVPEPDLSIFPLMETTDLQMGTSQIFTVMSNVESKMDMPNLELKRHNFLEIEHSMYSVDDIFSDYSIKKQVDLFEDAESLNSRKVKFPLLEVDEASLGIFNGIYTKAEISIFENIETQNWIQEVDLVIDQSELLGCTEFDLLKYMSDHLIECYKYEIPCLNFFQEMDYIISVQNYDDLSPLLYEEFSFFESEESHCFEVFSDVALVSEAKTFKTNSAEAMNFKSFNELIVSQELTLIDDSFKSMPVPIISENEYKKSLHTLVEEKLKNMEPQQSSISDGLYLDWHFLEEDKSNCIEYSSSWKLLTEINIYDTGYNFDFSESEMVIFHFILSGNDRIEPNLKEEKTILNVSSLDENREFRNGMNNVLIFDEGKSNMIDLDYFVNSRECARGSGSKPESSSNTVVSLPNSFDTNMQEGFFANSRECSRGSGSKPESSSNTITPCPVISSSNSFDTKLHTVHLSNDMLIIVDKFYKGFLDILQNDAEYKNLHGAENGLRFLTLPKEKLMHCIKSAPKVNVLCAIKQMAWYLIYYGIHATYLYSNKLYKSMECFRSRLSFLHNLIEDAHLMAEKEIHSIHPSLIVIQELLQDKGNAKVLIVAERIFWWPLEKLLNSLKISYNEPEKFCSVNTQQNAFKDDVINFMLNSDCCLISHEFISTSFPLNIFGTILEYGGSFSSSRVSTTLPVTNGCSYLHFLNVDLENSNIAKAICHGIEMPKYIKSKMGKNKLEEELLNFLPIEELNENKPIEILDDDDTCTIIPPPTIQQQQIYKTDPSFPKAIIIVNTLNFDKEMIISRRSTYQRILAMEKQGAQVIERDLNLPIDIILTASVCLAWYDCENIAKKATAPDEAFSCLPLCVENIAASILTSISFSFSGCILVFEGESGYLAGIMESSDELYAASASLGIDLQLFYSYSSEMTEEIILSCINLSSKLTKTLFPKIPESETLAESFLTSFPSINTLSAHAILSSETKLIEFLEWSPQQRIRALLKYHVPDESISLFSTLSRFGEHENSISGMTDCSSSVSSAHESENSHFNSNSVRKKRKYGENMFIDDIGKSNVSFNDELFGQSSALTSDKRLKLPRKRFSMEKVDIDMSFNPEEISELPLKHRVNRFSKKDIIGEVINVDTDLFMTDSFVNDSFTPTKLTNNVKEDSMSRIYEFHEENHPTFPSASEVDSEVNTWFSKQACEQNTDLKEKKISGDHQKGLLEALQRTSETPLSNAIRTAPSQQGSPWTIEFLNRIREKSIQKRKSLPSGISSPFCGSFVNIPRPSKRKSPSILEYYKYQGGKTTPQKPIQKRQIVKPSSLTKDKKPSVSFSPTWTPIDKKSRRALSFAPNGSGGQSKLVWGEKNTYTTNRRF